MLAPRLRQRIRDGRYTPEGLRRSFARCVDGTRDFDSLDVLIAALLNEGVPDEPRVALEKEMVAFQPTPARVVLELVERASIGPGDFLYDLGSGLGQVCLLASLVSGCRARGIELEPAYCAYATQTARALNLRNVDFVNADARVAPVDGGSVYFLFTPFRGAMLQQVISRLPRSARLCTHGPCTEEIARTTTLKRLPGEREVGVFVSASG